MKKRKIYGCSEAAYVSWKKTVGCKPVWRTRHWTQKIADFNDHGPRNKGASSPGSTF